MYVRTMTARILFVLLSIIAANSFWQHEFIMGIISTAAIGLLGFERKTNQWMTIPKQVLLANDADNCHKLETAKICPSHHQAPQNFGTMNEAWTFVQLRADLIWKVIAFKRTVSKGLIEAVHLQLEHTTPEVITTWDLTIKRTNKDFLVWQSCQAESYMRANVNNRQRIDMASEQELDAVRYIQPIKCSAPEATATKQANPQPDT